MGAAASTHDCKAQSTVPTGKIRICVAGFHYSPFTGRAHKLATEIAKAYPDQFETFFYWAGHGQFYRYLLDTFDPIPFPTKIKGHASSPFIWLEVAKSDATGASAEPCNSIDGNNAILQIIGGCDNFQRWAQRRIAKADGSGEALLAKQVNEEGATVAHGPDTLFFKASDVDIVEAATKIWYIWDMNHVVKYGEQTAAAAPVEEKKE